jgi:4-carboxymuconolactone decarboxylase/3-oxoadipate enol-lactonase/4-carboxymuconolactone decarboxylase
MDDQQRRASGTARRREVLGDAHVDRATAAATPLTRDFQDLLTRYAWGEIWARDHFDTRTRRILVIGTLIALGRHDELRLHVRAAIEQGGFSEADIAEIALQQAIYCGVPAANAALDIARQVVEERVR